MSALLEDPFDGPCAAALNLYRETVIDEVFSQEARQSRIVLSNQDPLDARMVYRGILIFHADARTLWTFVGVGLPLPVASVAERVLTTSTGACKEYLISPRSRTWFSKTRLSTSFHWHWTSFALGPLLRIVNGSKYPGLTSFSTVKTS